MFLCKLRVVHFHVSSRESQLWCIYVCCSLTYILYTASKSKLNFTARAQESPAQEHIDKAYPIDGMRGRYRREG